MSEPTVRELCEALAGGDDRAFERLYDRYHQRVRLVAWRISHRADWVDDLLNEGWTRAFHQRSKYDPKYDFMVWVVGIVRNVYREYCRQGRLTIQHNDDVDVAADGPTDDMSPEALAHEAEVLFSLNECVSKLSDEDGVIVRRRFFEGASLRLIAQELNLPEATLRASRVPGVLDQLRRCLAKKNIEIPAEFSARALGDTQ